MTTADVRLALKHTITCHRAPVTSMIYDDSGSVLFSGSADGTIVVHTVDANPNQEPRFLHRLHRTQAKGINALAWSANRVLAAGDDCAVLWDINVQKPMITLADHTLPVTDCDIYENYALTSSADQTINLVDMRQGKSISTMRAHTGAVLSCRLLPKLDILGPGNIGALTGGTDGMIKLWNAIQGNTLVTVKPAKPISTIQVSPNGKYALCSQVGAGVVLHSLPTDQKGLEIRKVKDYSIHESAEYLLPANYMWLKDTKTQMIACGSSRNQIVIYDIKRSDRMLIEPISLLSPPLAIASSANSQLLGVGCMDSRIHLFDIITE